MYIFQYGFNGLRHLPDGMCEIVSNKGERIEGPFPYSDSIVKRLTDLEELYAQNIDGWEFSFNPDGNILVKNDAIIRKSDSYFIHIKFKGSVDPRIIENDESNIIIDPMPVHDASCNLKEKDNVENSMIRHTPKVKECLFKFCKRFVEKAKELNFNPYND